MLQSANRIQTIIEDTSSSSNDFETDGTNTEATKMNFETDGTNDQNASREKVRVDSSALTGLRGFLAIHVMVFHFLLWCDWEIDILGSVVMTFFFLLSGFSLALCDGKRIYSRTPCCGEMGCVSLNSEDANVMRFDGKHFYQRRIARTLPLYYLANLVEIPLVFSGLPPFFLATFPLNVISGVLTFFVSTTWFGIPIVINGPSWFVSTIWFCYWLFPSLLPRFQRCSTVQKRNWLIMLFVLQFIIAGGLYMAIIAFVENEWSEMFAFMISTMWAPSRLPVFIMGVLGGLLRNEGLSMREGHSTWTVQTWAKCSDLLAIGFVISFVVIGVIQNAIFDLNAGLWMQLAIVWVALQFIVSLTFDEGTSWISKLLNSRLALAAGRISYALYLIHVPSLQYFGWILYGSEYGAEEEFIEIIPVWGVPVLCIASVVVSIALNRLFEEPLRKRLRPSPKTMDGGRKGPVEVTTDTISVR